MGIYSGFIHNLKNCKQPKCLSAGEWINILAPPQNGTLLNNKNKGATETNNDID